MVVHIGWGRGVIVGVEGDVDGCLGGVGDGGHCGGVVAVDGVGWFLWFWLVFVDGGMEQLVWFVGF